VPGDYLETGRQAAQKGDFRRGGVFPSKNTDERVEEGNRGDGRDNWRAVRANLTRCPQPDVLGTRRRVLSTSCQVADADGFGFRGKIARKKEVQPIEYRSTSHELWCASNLFQVVIFGSSS
jgi:hypothetical protein